MQLLFKNAYVVDVHSPYHLQTVDILVEGSQITSIGDLPEMVCPSVDLEGATLTTGFAELHSDLGEPGNEECETLETGAAAAASGGFTAVGVVSNGTPGIDNKTGIEFVLSKGESTAINLVPVGSASKSSAGEEMSDMFDMYQHGTILFGDYKQGMRNANLLKLALLYSKPFGRIMVHPEDANLAANGKVHEGVTSTYVGLKGIPYIAESVQIARDLKLLEYTEGSMHIASVSTSEGIKAVRDAKSKGLNLTCSVNIHHLLFDETAVATYDTNFKVAPPLRTTEDQNALWDALQDGTVDCLTVDHLPSDIELKACEFDNASFGMAGFEGALVHLLDAKKLDWELLQKLCSSNPRDLLGLPELKIVEGGIAEFTILDENGSDLTGFASKAYNNPFKGTTTKHRVVGVYVNGKYLGN